MAAPRSTRTKIPTAKKRVSRTSRRIGAENSKTRAVLLDAAERLMRKQGYAALTSRKVAQEAKITPQLVHYYFRTMDDLFLALWKRFVAKNEEAHAEALAAPDPLRALWKLYADITDVTLETEFIALAHHRKGIRKEITADGTKFRATQVAALARVLSDYGLEEEGLSADVVSTLLTSVARGIVLERDLGISVGHSQAFIYVDALLDRLARRAAKSRTQPKGRRKTPST